MVFFFPSPVGPHGNGKAYRPLRRFRGRNDTVPNVPDKLRRPAPGGRPRPGAQRECRRGLLLPGRSPRTPVAYTIPAGPVTEQCRIDKYVTLYLSTHKRLAPTPQPCPRRDPPAARRGQGRRGQRGRGFFV